MSDPSTTRPLPPAQLENLEEDVERTRAAIESHEVALDKLWGRLRVLGEIKQSGRMTIAQRAALTGPAS